ncbi:hypothetical protein F5B22DRAFT_658710 [Xylaria bambusicola]|uniref:uncharacterized protein n=1 Tax=Xylaria bambusicola TaxID=326684 RepID=UPI002007E5AA|nr:uncharacterized protein F5B22DRAFT_658710 [Xylaria bambusicola]KAI0509121.1 hypothetical protein F5B22DRAFT_658710 [Xylaria bambusicola]
MVNISFELSQHELEWQYEHRHETRVPGLIMACVCTAIASAVIVSLRLLSRRLRHGRLHLDASDWFLLVAWIFFAAVNISWAVGTKFEIGRHAVVVTDIRKVQVIAVVGEVAYTFAITLIKFSVLALYARAFPGPKFRYCVWGVALFVFGWGMSGSVVAIFQCKSIDDVWRPNTRDLCISLGLRNLVFGIINVVTDIIIMAMVIPLVWNHKVMGQERWLVLATFAVGISAWALGIVRLPFSIKVSANDRTWDAAPTVIVSLLEIVVGMLAVSMPTYLPLYKHIFRGGSCRMSNGSHVCSYKETLHMGLYGKGTHNAVNVTSPGTHMGSNHAGISVTNHIELIRHTNESGQWVRVTDDEDEELCEPTRREAHENESSTSVATKSQIV